MMDVDSTLIQQEVIDELAIKAGVAREVEAITQRAMAGELDFKESLRERVLLLKGMSENLIEAVASEITVTEGVLELLAAVHSAGGRVGVVSGGFSQVVDPLARELGIDYFSSNTLEVIDGVLTGRTVGDIVDAEAKAQALRDWAADFGVEIDKTVAIGDGANDIKMLSQAGFAVGFRPKEILREHADFVIDENSLFPLIAKLGLSTG